MRFASCLLAALVLTMAVTVPSVGLAREGAIAQPFSSKCQLFYSNSRVSNTNRQAICSNGEVLNSTRRAIFLSDEVLRAIAQPFYLKHRPFCSNDEVLGAIAPPILLKRQSGVGSQQSGVQNPKLGAESQESKIQNPYLSSPQRYTDE